MSDPKNLESAKLALAEELLGDIELSRLPPEKLLLKGARLARLTEDQEADQWLEFELHGYTDSPGLKEWMRQFKRWTNEKEGKGFVLPFAGLSAHAQALEAEMQQLRVPDLTVNLSSANPSEWIGGGVHGRNVDKATAPVQEVVSRLRNLGQQAAQIRGIQALVLAQLHAFVTRTYHQLRFSNLAESIFVAHQSKIDALLLDQAEDVLKKMPSISRRLREGDPEAISQAMNSCRRMITVFADSVQPPQDDPVLINSEPHDLKAGKVLNQVKYFLHQHCESKSRQGRLNKNLREIWDKVSAGVHADVTFDEAQALFLQTYLTLGEILTACSKSIIDAPALASPPATPRPLT